MKNKFQDEIIRKESDDEEDLEKPHKTELCSMCQRLGRPCNRPESRQSETPDSDLYDILLNDLIMQAK